MNKAEAKLLLADQLAAWRQRSYTDFVAMLGDYQHSDVLGPSGAHYQVDIQVFWDDKPHGHVRVLGAIDDGGIRAFAPLTDSFIMTPDGTFVDEGKMNGRRDS